MPDSGMPSGDAVRVHRVHALDRRARLRVASPMERPELVELAERLAAVAGVERVLARPATGSLIVETDRPVSDVLDEMVAVQLIAVVPAPHRPPVRQAVQIGLARADLGLQQRTDKALDLRTALGLLLLAGALVQLARGRIAAPATTLAIAALALLETDRPKV